MGEPHSPHILTFLRTLIVSLFGLMLAGCIILALWVSQRGVIINTDLQSISPHFIQDKNLEQAVNSVSASLQQNLLLVLKSHSREDLEDVLYSVPDLLAELDLTTITYSDPDTRLEQILNAIEDNRFYLLTDEQIQEIEGLDNEQLLNRAHRRLRSMSGSARFFDLTTDPMGTVSDYTLALLENLPDGQSGFAAVEENGTEVFYAPLTFTLLPNAQDFNQQAFVADDINAIENLISENYPTLEILHSGVFFFSASAATSARSDITLISTGSTVGILLLLVYFFRSLRTVLLPLISIAVGVAFAFLCCQALFGAIHVFTIVFGASLIGVVIDYALHYAYHSDNQPGTRIKLYQALFLSLLTSVIGYGALAFSGLQVLQQVAVFSALGLVSAWIVVVALGLLLLPDQQKVYDAGLQRGIQWMLAQLHWLNVKLFSVLYVVIIGGAIAVILSQIQFDDSPRSFFEPAPDLLAEEAEIEKVVSNYEPATYLVIRGNTEQAIYDNVNQLFSEQPAQRDSLFGIHHLINSPRQRQQAYELNSRLYGENGMALRFLRELEIPSEKVEQLMFDYRQAGLNPPTASKLLGDGTLPMPPIWKQLNGAYYAFFLLTREADFHALENFASNKQDVFFIDTVGMSTTAIQALRQSANNLLALALGLVATLMFIRYRRFTRVGLIAVPLASIVLTLALFALTNTMVSLFHMMALFLVLGLGMDYVIFVADLSERGRQTLSAVVLSAVTSLLAFGLLSLSQLPVVQAFGLTVLIGNSINIIGAFFAARFLLPTSTSQSVK